MLDDHPLGDPGLLAAAAEQGTFEVVVVDAAAFLGGGVGLDDVLDALEEIVTDESLVASHDLFVLVSHVAEVVAVAQHHRQFVDRDLLGGVVGRVCRPRS